MSEIRTLKLEEIKDMACYYIYLPYAEEVLSPEGNGHFYNFVCLKDQIIFFTIMSVSLNDERFFEAYTDSANFNSIKEPYIIYKVAKDFRNLCGGIIGYGPPIEMYHKIELEPLLNRKHRKKILCASKCEMVDYSNRKSVGWSIDQKYEFWDFDNDSLDINDCGLRLKMNNRSHTVRNVLIYSKPWMEFEDFENFVELLKKTPDETMDIICKKDESFNYEGYSSYEDFKQAIYEKILWRNEIKN